MSFLLVVPLLAISTSTPPLIIVQRESGQCVTVEGEGGRSDAALVLSTCRDSADQTFTYSANQEIRNGNDCAEALTGTGATRIALRPCNGGESQRWTLEGSDITPVLNPELTLATGPDDTHNVTGILLRPRNGSTSGIWVVRADPRFLFETRKATLSFFETAAGTTHDWEEEMKSIAAQAQMESNERLAVAADAVSGRIWAFQRMVRERFEHLRAISTETDAEPSLTAAGRELTEAKESREKIGIALNNVRSQMEQIRRASGR